MNTCPIFAAPRRLGAFRRPPSTPSRRWIAASVWLAVVSAAPGAAFALACPEPPKQADKDWETQVRAEVGRIGPVRGAELETRVRNTTQDLMTKLPGADRLYLEQMMFAAYCSALRDDKALAESAKAAQVMEYRRELQKSLRP